MAPSKSLASALELASADLETAVKHLEEAHRVAVDVAAERASTRLERLVETADRLRKSTRELAEHVVDGTDSSTRAVEMLSARQRVTEIPRPLQAALLATAAVVLAVSLYGSIAWWIGAGRLPERVLDGLLAVPIALAVLAILGVLPFRRHKPGLRMRIDPGAEALTRDALESALYRDSRDLKADIDTLGDVLDAAGMRNSQNLVSAIALSAIRDLHGGSDPTLAEANTLARQIWRETTWVHVNRDEVRALLTAIVERQPVSDAASLPSYVIAAAALSASCPDSNSLATYLDRTEEAIDVDVPSRVLAGTATVLVLVTLYRLTGGIDPIPLPPAPLVSALGIAMTAAFAWRQLARRAAEKKAQIARRRAG